MDEKTKKVIRGLDTIYRERLAPDEAVALDAAIAELTRLAAVVEKQNGLPFVIAYFDRGPAGPCGQTMDVTCPWTILYAFESEDQYEAWVRLDENNGQRFGRRGTRIECRRVWNGNDAPAGARWVDMRATVAAALAAAEGGER